METAAKNIQTKRDEEAWEIEVKAEIPAARMTAYRDEALKELQKTAKMDGFRPGKVPLDRIVAVYGEPTLLRLAAERAIQHEVPEILAKENILIIAAPRVETSTPETGKPLSFAARAPLPPKVELPDWKTIAHKHNEKKVEQTVNDDEYAQALVHIRRERARIEKMEKGEDPTKAMEAAKALPEPDLPPIDDEFAKSLGYQSSAHFGEVLRSNMKSERELQEKQARRTAILEDLAQEATIKYPATLREYELDDMEERIKADLARIGSTFEHYLEQIKKTREQLRKEWESVADKRAKTRLILTEIAKQEKIAPNEDRVESELKHAKDHYKDADPNNLRAGIVHALRNEKVLELLESQ